jgi:hypothetical protein
MFASTLLSDNPCCLSRKEAVQLALDSVHAEVERLQVMAAEVKIKADSAADQCRGRLAGIQQLQESITEMEEDSEKEVLERILQGHMKKLSEYAQVVDQER